VGHTSIKNSFKFDIYPLKVILGQARGQEGGTLGTKEFRTNPCYVSNSRLGFKEGRFSTG